MPTNMSTIRGRVLAKLARVSEQIRSIDNWMSCFHEKPNNEMSLINACFRATASRS